MLTPARDRADACPGVFAPHDAADGALARVRLPGGVLSAARIRVLAGCADEFGDGAVHLTSRGNLQLRGLDRTDPRPGSRLAAAGLVPSVTHERVRNVVASPFSGIHGGLADVRGMAGALDRELCARPALAGLPGRFLFAIDDGRGDVGAEGPDLCWRADGPDTGTLLVAATPVAAVGRDAAVRALLGAAEAFLRLREADGGTGWRAEEVRDAAARIAALLADDGFAPARGASRPDAPTGPEITVGPLRRDDGGRALVAAPLLGELSVAQLRLLARLAPQVVVTPWRTIVLPDAAPQALELLAGAGLVVDPAHPAAGVSACAGRPGCAKALADVRADARSLLAGDLGSAGRIHLAGCERRCGAPHGTHHDVVATSGGEYLVDGTPVPVTALRRTLAGAGEERQ